MSNCALRAHLKTYHKVKQQQKNNSENNKITLHAIMMHVMIVISTQNKIKTIFFCTNKQANQQQSFLSFLKWNRNYWIKTMNEMHLWKRYYANRNREEIIANQAKWKTWKYFVCIWSILHIVRCLSWTKCKHQNGEHFIYVVYGNKIDVYMARVLTYMQNE